MIEKFIYNLNINLFITIIKYLMAFFILYFILKSRIIIKNKSMSNNTKTIKICICTLGKKENKYILEFVEYYKKIGIDKIFLYDNNELNGENFTDILHDYIITQFIEIINYRGEIAPQFKIYNDCYNKNYKLYNWLIFFDIDEFINLQNYSNIKYFLNENKFKKCKLIYLNCIRHTDNDLLHYDNRSLRERFPKIKWTSKMYTVKTIMKGNLEGVNFKTCHWLDRSIMGCNTLGKLVKPNRKVKIERDFNESFFKFYYIDHYCFKSTEEYINKINKGDGILGISDKNKMHKIDLYFKYNTITMQKIIYIEQKTGLNLSKYKLQINKKTS